MITKLLDSQSFSKVWKTAVRQKFCAMVSKIWSRNIIWRLLRGDLSCLLMPRISLQALGKNYIGYMELRLKTCNNLKSVIVWNASFRLASRSFKNAGPNNSMIFNRRIDRSQCFGGHHILTENCKTYFVPINESFQKVKYKLDLIEQAYLDKIHSRLMATVNGL